MQGEWRQPVPLIRDLPDHHDIRIYCPGRLHQIERICEFERTYIQDRLLVMV